MTEMRGVAAAVVAVVAATSPPAHAEGNVASMPRYDHIFVIIEENHSNDEIIGNPAAPNINRLATTYGYASNFYAERHPSEPNYVAMVGGDTFGVADDDAIYCKPHSADEGCEKSDRPGYVDHTIDAPNLAQQLDAHGLSWKGYFESLPAPGSLVYRWPSPKNPAKGLPYALYASKHNGFVDFRSVQDDPARARKIVGFDILYRDIAAGELPNYAQIVPNQCDDMHGIKSGDAPPDCRDRAGLVARADRMIGDIVDKIMSSSIWSAPGNAAIVITFDENDDHRSDGHPPGCCGYGDPHNPGGGWIPTLVITNHGPRHAVDPTPYNHYSLLRTTQAAFGLLPYLGHAADSDKGVATMTPLFAIGRK